MAARAERHLCVRKLEGRSQVDLLESEEDRLQELALMIKGDPVTPASLAQARELLAEAQTEPVQPVAPVAPRAAARRTKAGKGSPKRKRKAS